MANLRDTGTMSILCVDSVENGAASGRFYYNDLSSERSFRSLDQLLLELDRMMDGEEGSEAVPVGTVWRTGRLATFKVQVLFRQNASWQGSVTWLETRHEENFRSALELLSILHQALAPAQQRRMRPSSLKIAK